MMIMMISGRNHNQLGKPSAEFSPNTKLIILDLLLMDEYAGQQGKT